MWDLHEQLACRLTGVSECHEDGRNGRRLFVRWVPPTEIARDNDELGTPGCGYSVADGSSVSKCLAWTELGRMRTMAREPLASAAVPSCEAAQARGSTKARWCGCAARAACACAYATPGWRSKVLNGGLGGRDGGAEARRRWRRCRM